MIPGRMDGLAALFRFNVWSFAMPAAVISGYWVALRRARQSGVETHEFERATQWAVGAGFVVSHMVEVLFYGQEKLHAEGILTLFKFWEGLSSYGGFFGAAVALVVFYGIRRRTWWREADALILGLVIGWIFGRFGCAVAGDHPGGRADYFLAYPYPDGPRHNLGLYELLYTALVMLPANLLLYRRKPPTGSFVALNCLLYGIGRLALDFMRSSDREDSDPRYLGLTLAQYCSLAVLVLGLWALRRARARPAGARTGTAPYRPR